MLWKTINAGLIAAGLMLVYVLLLSLSAHGAPYPDHSELRPTCRVVWSLTEPAVVLPADMCDGKKSVVYSWFNCEVNGWWTKWDSPADAVNPVSGAKGIAQIMELHRPRMASLGLDYDRERDRLLYAGILFNESGSRPWECVR